jgi:hypothetical protein
VQVTSVKKNIFKIVADAYQTIALTGVSKSVLGQSLLEAFQNNQFEDVVFVCGSEKIGAHKIDIFSIIFMIDKKFMNLHQKYYCIADAPNLQNFARMRVK